MGLLALIVFLVVLAKVGRIGPFLWDPRPHRALACAGATASGHDNAERILAQRLADGDLTTDDYYERLSLIQAR